MARAWSAPQTGQALDRLASESPAAALKAAGRLEILAMTVGYHAAGAAWSMGSDELGAALGINGELAEDLLHRYRRR